MQKNRKFIKIQQASNCPNSTENKKKQTLKSSGKWLKVDKKEIKIT